MENCGTKDLDASNMHTERAGKVYIQKYMEIRNDTMTQVLQVRRRGQVEACQNIWRAGEPESRLLRGT